MIFRLDISKKSVIPIEQTSYAQLDINEDFIQTTIEANPFYMLDEDILITGRQICDWDKTNERCDLFGIDRNGKLVVIEVKRDGNQQRDKNVTIQSIKYASYFSTYKLKDVVEQYMKYANKDTYQDAEQDILSHVSNRNDNFQIDNKPRIIIIGKEFPQEVTASVLWLKEYDIDIKCISITPYKENDNIYIDRKTIIPLEETEKFMVCRKEKNDSIEKEQNEKIKQRFNNFINKLNGNIFAKNNQLNELNTGTNHISYFYYGNKYYHYEIFIPEYGNCIDIGFHFEGSIDEQKFNDFMNAKEIPLKNIGFTIFKDKNTQKGCIYKIILPCQFSTITNNELDKAVKEASDKFCELYGCISGYVDKNLLNR